MMREFSWLFSRSLALMFWHLLHLFLVLPKVASLFGSKVLLRYCTFRSAASSSSSILSAAPSSSSSCTSDEESSPLLDARRLETCPLYSYLPSSSKSGYRGFAFSSNDFYFSCVKLKKFIYFCLCLLIKYEIIK